MGWTVWSDRLDGTTNEAVATVVFDSRLHVFAVGIDDSMIYTKSTANGKSWGNWSSCGKKTNAAVTPVVFEDELFLFAKGRDDRVYQRSKSKITGWGEWELFSGVMTNIALAAAEYRSRLYVFAKKVDNQIYVRSRPVAGAWSDWQSLGGTTDVPVTTAKFQNRLYVFAKGLDDDGIYHSSLGASGGWEAWQGLGGKTSVPIAAAAYAGDLHLFARGYSDKRIYGMLAGANNSWSSWYPVPAVETTTRTALAAATFDNALHLFRVDRDDRKIYTQRQMVYDLPFERDGTWTTSGNFDTGGHGFGDQAFDYDFSHAEGAEIRAVRAGKVIFLENHAAGVNPDGTPTGPDYAGWGTCLHIRHSDGSVAAYMHLKFNSIKTNVVCGGNVAEGQAIARSGNTGRSFNPHLHFGMHSFEQLDSTCEARPGHDVQGQHIPVYFKSGNMPYRPANGDVL